MSACEDLGRDHDREYVACDPQHASMQLTRCRTCGVIEVVWKISPGEAPQLLPAARDDDALRAAFRRFWSGPLDWD